MIWRPPIVDALGFLVGMQWPEGNEDKMWQLATDWRTAAKNLKGINADLDAAISAVELAYPQGDGGKEMLEQLKALRNGTGKDHEGSLDSIATWFDSIASTADNTGTEFEYTKLMFYAVLLMLAAEFAIAALFPPTAAAADAAQIAATRITVRILMRRLLAKISLEGMKFAEIATLRGAMKVFGNAALYFGLGAGLGALPDAAIQGWQRYAGRREKFDWKQTGTMALAGGVGGLVAAPIGAGLGRMFGKPTTRMGRIGTGAVIIAGAGGSAGLAGWGVNALVTGNHEFDPRIVTAGMTGGMAPGLLKAARGGVHTPSGGLRSDVKLGNGKSLAALGDGSTAAGRPHGDTTGAGNGIRVGDAAGAGSHAGQRLGTAEANGASPSGARAADPNGFSNGLTHNGIGNDAAVSVQPVAAAPGGHVAAAIQDSADVKAPAAAPSAVPTHPGAEAKVTPEARQPGTNIARPDATGTTASPEGSRAAGTSREGATPNAVQAKATGAEAATRAGTRVEGAPIERVGGTPVREGERQPGGGTGRNERPDVRIGGRADEGTGGGESGPGGNRTPDRGEQPAGTGRTPHGEPRGSGRDENGSPHDEGAADRNPAPDEVGSRGPHGPDETPPRGDRSPEHPVLPEDRPLTEAEHTHARDALEGLGRDADARQLLHPDDVDQAGAHARAAQNHEWWHSLTPDQRAAMIRVHPHEIGNADGIPARVRDEANRLSMTRDLADLRLRHADRFLSRFTDPENYRIYKNLESTVKNLERAERLADAFVAQKADEYGGHRPPVRVLSYDAAAFKGEGRAVVAIGDVDRASTVSWHVPGITTTVRSLKVNLENAFNHFWETSEVTRDPAAVASIAWIGYDAPSGFPKIVREMTNTRLAERGGQLLARDLAAFNESRRLTATLPDGAAPPAVHVFGHSYGSTTTSFGGAGGRLAGEVTTITLLGSPGAGPLLHASDFGVGAHNVFVASSPRDPVTWIGSSTPGEIGRVAPGLGMGLGMDPSVEAFGARRITAQFPGGTHTFSNISTHTAYYKYLDSNHQIPSESLRNFAHIAAGEPHNAIPEYARPDRDGLNAWQRNVGTTPHDPARWRSPLPERDRAPYGYEVMMNEHRTPEPAAERASPRTENPPANDCGPRALEHARDVTGNESIRVPTDPEIAQRGMTARELEEAAGARMRRMETPGVLADHLSRLGDGATAIVVHEYRGPVAENGVGAHAFTVTNEGGRLVVHDSALEGGPRRFPPDGTDVHATYAILYDSHGSPVHPIESRTPESHPGSRIGQPDPAETHPTAHPSEGNAPRPGYDNAGKTAEEIAAERVKLANENDAWFQEHYKENGHRKEAERMVDNHPLPQLQPDKARPGKWKLAETGPPPLPKKFKASPAGVPDGSIDKLPATVKNEMDAITKERAQAIKIDTAHHARIENAETAVKAASQRLEGAEQRLVADNTTEARKAHEEAKIGHKEAEARLASEKSEHKAPHHAMTKIGERLGEQTAEQHAVPEHFPNAEKVALPDLGYGQRQFDLIYKTADGGYLVIEAKAPSAELGSSTLHNGKKVQQGRLDYFESVLEEMKARGRRLNNGERELALKLEAALEDGRVEYVLVKAKAEGERYTGYELKYFDLDKATQPGGYQGRNGGSHTALPDSNGARADAGGEGSSRLPAQPGQVTRPTEGHPEARIGRLRGGEPDAPQPRSEAPRPVEESPRPQPEPNGGHPAKIRQPQPRDFEQMRTGAAEIMSAYRDPAHHGRLPELRTNFAALLDELGLRHPDTQAAHWRLLEQYDAKLAKAFTDYSQSLLPHPGDAEVVKPQHLSTDHVESAAPKPHAEDMPEQLPLDHQESQLHPELTEAEHAALRLYTDPDADIYTDLNNRLRQGLELSPEQQRIADTISTALSKLPMHEGTVWRATSLAPEDIGRYVKGATVTEPPFTSTSRDPNRTFTGNVEFVLHSRTGRDISGFSARPRELEVLFGRDTTFEVRGIVHDPNAGLFGRTRIYLYESAERPAAHGAVPIHDARPEPVPLAHTANHDQAPNPVQEHEIHQPGDLNSHAPTAEPVHYGADRTALGDSPEVQRAFQNLRNEGEHDVIVHGDRFGHPTVDGGYEIDPHKVVEAIRSNPDYVPGTPVRLVSCHSGNGIGWAQHVARELGVPVRAPSDMVGVRNHPDSPAVIHGDGVWRTFHPDLSDGTTPEPTVHASASYPAGSLIESGRIPDGWDVLEQDASSGHDPFQVAVDRNVDLSRIGVDPVWRTDSDPVYRSDNRSPELIFENGFGPRDTTYTDLADYVAEDKPSAFVSTSRSDDIGVEIGAKYTYEIDAPGGIDVNETLGPHEKSYEHEISFPGGIRSEFIQGVRSYNYATGELGEFIPNPNYRPLE